MISARHSQIESRAAAGSKVARTTLCAMEHATLMLATSQPGITVCSLLVTFPHVVLGEMVPKNLAFSVPDRSVLVLAPALVLASRVLRPVIGTLNWIADGVLRAFRVQSKNRRDGTLVDDSGMVAGAFEFNDKSVAEVEVARHDLVLLSPQATPADVQQSVDDHGHSRYVVTDEAGRPAGYLHMKDVMDLRDEEFRRPDADVRRARRARRADDRGEPLGLLFLEDVLEVLIGEVDDAA